MSSDKETQIVNTLARLVGFIRVMACGAVAIFLAGATCTLWFQTRIEQRIELQVRLGRRRRAYVHGFVGQRHMRGVAVGIAVNSYGLVAQVSCGANHPAGDLTTVGDQYCVEHATHILKTP